MKTNIIQHRALTVVAVLLAGAVLGSAPALADPATGSSTPSSPSKTPQTQTPPTCSPLYVLGVQSADEGAATSVDTGDSGILGQALGRMASKASGGVERSYIVFAADMDSTNYSAAVATAADQIEQQASEVLERCPSTQIAVAGYAQGAAAASTFAENSGSGRSRISADKIAGIALLANPSRRAATGALPGTDNASVPAAAPGTDGANVSKISLTNTGLSGAGIAAATTPISYGALVGRVADLCVAGDATCDVQSGSPLLTAVNNISGQAEGKDPVAAISTVAQALASTAFTTAVGVVNDDISGTTLDQLTYTPSQTLGQRIASASSPTATTADASDALSALFKIGTIGLNAVVAVAQKVFTATTIAELAAVGLSNPIGAVAVLGTKLADAVVDLVPPQSISTWVNDAFQAITSTITDTGDLYTTSATSQYSTSSGRRVSYSTTSSTANGESPLDATAAWFAALATDLASATPTTSASTPARSISTSSQQNPPPTSVKPTPTQSTVPTAATTAHPAPTAPHP